jgi:hypothetical protein
MGRTARILLSLGFLVFGLGCPQSRADGYVVNNIWWNFIINYNNSGQTVCVAKQWNPQTLIVRFDVFPVLPNNPHHGTVTATMIPYHLQNFWLARRHQASPSM